MFHFVYVLGEPFAGTVLSIADCAEIRTDDGNNTCLMNLIFQARCIVNKVKSSLILIWKFSLAKSGRGNLDDELLRNLLDMHGGEKNIKSLNTASLNNVIN